MTNTRRDSFPRTIHWTQSFNFLLRSFSPRRIKLYQKAQSNSF
jgi:hypothetical protein